MATLRKEFNKKKKLKLRVNPINKLANWTIKFLDL